jgi:hypothetical protein
MARYTYPHVSSVNLSESRLWALRQACTVEERYTLVTLCTLVWARIAVPAARIAIRTDTLGA